MSDPVRALEVATGKSVSSGSGELPQIPAVPATGDQGVNNFLSSVKNWLEKASGSTLGSFATKRDLVNAGVADIATGQDVHVGSTLSLLVPPVPTGFLATGAFEFIILEWDNPIMAYRNHSHAEIWGADNSSSLSNAVLVTKASGTHFSHHVGTNASWYYWIKFVSTSGTPGPFNSVNGTHGVTATDTSYLLGKLNGALTESELHTDLNTRLDLIDTTTFNEATANGGLLLKVKNSGADITNLQVQVAALTNPAFDAQHAGGYADGDIVSYSGKLWECIQDTAEPPDIPAPAENAYWTKISDYSDWTAAVSAEQTTRAAQDEAIANAVNGVSSTLNGSTTAIATQATSINGIQGKYSVKIDANGYVSGFGLISTANNATPTSEFVIVADKFSIAPVATNPASSDGSPFYYLTSPTTIDGVMVPSGAYMKNAYIAALNANKIVAGNIAADRMTTNVMSAVNASIDNISATKMTTNVISAINASIEYVNANRIDTRGLSIKDATGNVILGSGTALDAALAPIIQANTLSNAAFLGTGALPDHWAMYNNGNITAYTWVGRREGLFGANCVYLQPTQTLTSTFGVYTSVSSGGGVRDDGYSGCWYVGWGHFISFYARAVPGYPGFAGKQMTACYSNQGWSAFTDVSNPLLTTDWQRYVFRAVPANNNASAADGQLYISWLVSGSVPANALLQICCPKVELDSIGKCTAWNTSNYDVIGRGNPVTAGNISTYIASAAIGNAQIDRATANKLSVGTLDIQGQAVTVPVSSTGASGTASTPSSYFASQPVVIIATARGSAWGGSGTYSELSARIKRDDGLVLAAGYICGTDAEYTTTIRASATLLARDSSPGESNRSYTVEEYTSTGTNTTKGDCAILALGCKR